MNLSKIKNLFLKVLIVCLVAAACVAVTAVLAGGLNDILNKALFTIVIVATHSLVSFGFITNNEKQDTFENLSFFTNATFGIIVFSFITAIGGIWSIVSPDLVGKLYELFFVLLFAILHAEVLFKTLHKQTAIDVVVYANYVLLVMVIAMLIPAIFTGFETTSLGSFYYRLLAAAGIVDATLTLIAVILHRLYVQKHPAVVDSVFAMPAGPVASQTPNTQPVTHGKTVLNLFVYILAGLMALQLTAGILFYVVFALLNR